MITKKLVVLGLFSASTVLCGGLLADAFKPELLSPVWSSLGAAGAVLVWFWLGDNTPAKVHAVARKLSRSPTAVAAACTAAVVLDFVTLAVWACYHPAEIVRKAVLEGARSEPVEQPYADRCMVLGEAYRSNIEVRPEKLAGRELDCTRERITIPQLMNVALGLDPTHAPSASAALRPQPQALVFVASPTAGRHYMLRKFRHELAARNVPSVILDARGCTEGDESLAEALPRCVRKAVVRAAGRDDFRVDRFLAEQDWWLLVDGVDDEYPTDRFLAVTRRILDMWKERQHRVALTYLERSLAYNALTNEAVTEVQNLMLRFRRVFLRELTAEGQQAFVTRLASDGVDVDGIRVVRRLSREHGGESPVDDAPCFTPWRANLGSDGRASRALAVMTRELLGDPAALPALVRFDAEGLGTNREESWRKLAEWRFGLVVDKLCESGSLCNVRVAHGGDVAARFSRMELQRVSECVMSWLGGATALAGPAGRRPLVSQWVLDDVIRGQDKDADPHRVTRFLLEAGVLDLRERYAYRVNQCLLPPDAWVESCRTAVPKPSGTPPTSAQSTTEEQAGAGRKLPPPG